MTEFMQKYSAKNAAHKKYHPANSFCIVPCTVVAEYDVCNKYGECPMDKYANSCNVSEFK
jgi:hypothetical protein